MLGAVLGAALVLLAAGRPWVHAVAVAEPVRVPLSVKGASLSPVVPAAGLVCLAGAVGILAARGALRRVIGALIAVAGLGAVVATALAVAPGSAELSDRAGEAVGTASAAAAAVEHTAWPWPGMLGALIAAAAGLLTVVRGGMWPGMSSRYERPDVAATQAATPRAQGALDQWRALDRGEDPTL